MWIGRVGNGIGSPCGANPPLGGSMAKALTWCMLPTWPPTPEALSLVAA